MEFQDVVNKFRELFHDEPLLVRSPGRINLIGEHTDYNNGFVMPAAIDKEIFFAVQESPSTTSNIHSLKYKETFSFDSNHPKRVKSPAWANYVLGVLQQMIDKGLTIKSFNCAFGGNIPLGAGLSSSAALECGFAFAMNELNRFNIGKKELILMAQWSEHHYVGVKCGIMDQFASMMGYEDHVILLDCRSLSYRYFPIELNDYTIVLCDTHVKHSLVDSEYNTRRNECEQGVSILQKYYPEINSLRDATMDMLMKHKAEMPGKVFDRCRYIVQENERVQQAGKSLEEHNLKAFGKKMYETHEGLSKLYEVSCPELDFLVDQAKAFVTVLGARMMGGGFGGCTINLVPKQDVESFVSTLTDAYQKAFNLTMGAHVVRVRAGTSVIQTNTEKHILI